MSTVTIVMLVILAILIAAFIALYFFGKKMEKKAGCAEGADGCHCADGYHDGDR